MRRLGFERGDLLVGLAENSQPIAHRGERDLVAADSVLRRDEIGLGLLPILERAALGQIKITRAFFIGLRLRELRARRLQIGERGDQVILLLHELARLDLEERRAGLDMIAQLRNQFDDPPRIRRKYRGGQIVVDCDAAFRHLFRTEADEANGLDLEPRPLLLGWPENSRGCRRRRPCTLGLIRGVLPDHRPGKDRNADKHCRERDQHKLSNRRQMPAQQGDLPDILRHQLLTNAATSFHNQGYQPLSYNHSQGFHQPRPYSSIPEESADRQRTRLLRKANTESRFTKRGSRPRLFRRPCRRR